MLSSSQFIRQSLEIHLFFGRIMKEHSFFLEVSFTPRDSRYTKQADTFRNEFDALLGEVILLSNRVVSNEVLQSGEVITKYTLDAEKASAFFTGVNIRTELTGAEAVLTGGEIPSELIPNFQQRVNVINQRAINLISALIKFKTDILSNVLACKMFTVNYPLMIDHILREARLYLSMVQRLQNKEEIKAEMEMYQQEFFWDRIMAEHSKFIRGLLDPTENDLIITANNFGNEFDQLTNETKQAMDKMMPIEKVTEDSLKATTELRDFKAVGTQGILECKVKSIIIPLLADHTLREANHYLRLLKMFQM